MPKVPSFLLLNLLLVFSTIYIANKTREIEKNNYNFEIKISNIKEELKINKIEYIAHQNSSYLKKLYSIYFHKLKNHNLSNVISLNQFSDDNQNIKLVKTEN